MGRNRVFKNTITTESSKLTSYKKNLENFKFASNKPESKPVKNFNINYATNEITQFQDFSTFRGMAGAFYATAQDCSMNLTVPFSVANGNISSITYADVCANVIADSNSGGCHSADGLFPYGKYSQTPDINLFDFPSKISVDRCNTQLTTEDAVIGFGTRSIHNSSSVQPEFVPEPEPESFDFSASTSNWEIDEDTPIPIQFFMSLIES